MAAALHLHDEQRKRSWQIWPAAESPGAGAVQEARSYVFELADCPGAEQAELLIDEEPLLALRARGSGTARWQWSPGFQAGSVDVELRIPGHSPVVAAFTTDPDRNKLTRDQFNTMVAEILEDTFALFSLSAFRIGISSSVSGRPPPLATLEFLRSRITELEILVRDIARYPRRRVVADEVTIPLHRAAHATGPQIVRSMRSGRLLRETRVPSRLPAALNGVLPAAVRLPQKLSSTDTPENRQIGACMSFWAAWMFSAAARLRAAPSEDGFSSADNGRGAGRRTTGNALWARRCRRLGERLQELASLPPFAGARTPLPALKLSAVFRLDPAYRRFYRLWQDLNRGIGAVHGDFLELPLSRTFQLYELWCYLRLLRSAALISGKTPDVTPLFTQGPGGSLTYTTGAVTVPVGPDISLCFQRTFREFWTDPTRTGSFSREMTPDIVITSRAAPHPEEQTDLSNAGPMAIVVLDAKYRVDQGLSDALSSIHTYRDALVSEHGGSTRGIVKAAYLLTPQLCPSTTQDWRRAQMPARLFHPDYRSAFRFGALTLAPGMPLEEVASALRGLLQDASPESDRADHGRSHP